jgi:uncharacterized protein (TIGR03435 family)
VKRPRLTDNTRLVGRYDFTLEFSCGGCVAAAPVGSVPAPADGAVLGNDGVTIFVAVEKQLGLRAVKTEDIPLQVVVVDKVARIPAAN